MTPTHHVLGFVTEANYPLFRNIVADPAGYPESYAKFLERYQDLLRQAKATGIPVIELQIDPQELADWCRSQGSPVNSTMRGAFNAFKVHSAIYKQPQ